VNDADFEMLARTGGGAFDAWLRSQALGHAIVWLRGQASRESLTASANSFYDYIKGGNDENLRRQDER
jgi:hypothetical protein